MTMSLHSWRYRDFKRLWISHAEIQDCSGARSSTNMLFSGKIQRKHTILLLGTCILVVLVMGIHFSSPSLTSPLASQEKTQTKQSAGDATVTQLPRVPNVILFPRNYPVNDKKQLAAIYEGQLGRTLPSADRDTYFIGKYVPASINVNGDQRSLPLTQDTVNKSYRETKFALFTEHGETEGADKCTKFRLEMKIDVSMPKVLDTYIHEVVEKFYHSPFYKEHQDVFVEHPLDKQLKARTVHEYWARFGGSSVYLEQYGVHFMVSRFLYSAIKERGGPTINLLLGEVYDHHWNLIPGAQLVVPSNDPDKGHADAGLDTSLAEDPSTPIYRVVDAAAVLPVPIFQRMKTSKGMLFGPEDPRMLLVTNELGHEEPLVVFNEMHRKQIKIEENNVDEPKVKLKQFRSMFQCFPWQVQRGKLNVDGLPSKAAIDDEFKGMPLHQDALYLRTMEMRISGKERPGVQKNWTPFVSAGDRAQYGHDKFLYIVYRWSDFEVLECPIHESKSGVSDCRFAYKSKPDNKITEGPGPFRGGTALISVNAFLSNNIKSFPQIGTYLNNLKESKREVWVGLARAHLDGCGCGNGAFYRPNLVVITREFDGRFVFSHVGLYASLEVPMMGWDLKNPDKLCPEGSASGPTSVLIPNLITDWSFQNRTEDENVGENDMPQDFLALTLSISDANNMVVHIRGLLNSLLGMDATQDGDVQIFNTAGIREPRKPTNDALDCALAQSKKFCATFGEENK